jgi:predicted RNase H-like HicB family nuclease
MRLKVVWEPTEEGGCKIHVPTLPGFISEDETAEETQTNIPKAIDSCLESVDIVPIILK